MADLGCKPWREQPSFDCYPRLQAAVSNAYGAGSNLHIYVPGELWRLNNTVVLPQRTGLCFESNGYGLVAGEGNAVKASNVGPLGRFGWGGTTDKPMFQLEGMGTRFQGIHFLGYISSGYLSDIQAAAKSSFCQTLVLVKGGPLNGLATGNVVFSFCSFGAFQTAIQCGEAADDDNADTVFWDRAFASVGSRFLKCMNHQSVCNGGTDLQAWQLDDAVFDIQAGGKLNCETVSMVSSPCTFLRTNDVQFNGGLFRIGMLNIDAGSGGAALRVLKMQAAKPAHFDMGLHIGRGIAGTPLFEMKGCNDGATRLILREAYGLRERIIKTTATTGTPHIVLDGGMFEDAHDPTKLLHAGSTGFAHIDRRSVSAYNGTRITSGEFEYLDGVQL